MSRTIGGSAPAGNPMAIGFVPSMRSPPHNGATPLLLLVMDQPIMSRAIAFIT